MRTAALLAGMVCLALTPGAAWSAGAAAAAPSGPGAAASAASASAPGRAAVATHELRLVDGQVATGSRLLAALKGDALRWRITSNRPGQLHLHAYRLSLAVVPGQAAELAFVAHATGRFRIEWHAADAAAAKPRLAAQLAISLVPIALAYNVAHNFSTLLIQGQTVLQLLSDPFGRQWDLFGTARWCPDIGLIAARLTWFVAVTAIALGHVVSIWWSHRLVLAAGVPPRWPHGPHGPCCR